jgi:hypothetical protein
MNSQPIGSLVKCGRIQGTDGGNVFVYEFNNGTKIVSVLGRAVEASCLSLKFTTSTDGTISSPISDEARRFADVGSDEY